MGNGTWTLRCESCQRTFESMPISAANIIEYAKSKPCPHCRFRPVATEGLAMSHHIIGFHTAKSPSKMNPTKRLIIWLCLVATVTAGALVSLAYSGLLQP